MKTGLVAFLCTWLRQEKDQDSWNAMLVWWWQALLQDADLADQSACAAATAWLTSTSKPALCASCTAASSCKHVLSCWTSISKPACHHPEHSQLHVTSHLTAFWDEAQRTCEASALHFCKHTIHSLLFPALVAGNDSDTFMVPCNDIVACRTSNVAICHF